MVIPGMFMSGFSSFEPIEVTKNITKSFTDNVYIFMLGRGKVLDLKLYSQEKNYYRQKGHTFDEDIIEVFIESHMAWTKK